MAINLKAILDGVMGLINPKKRPGDVLRGEPEDPNFNRDGSPRTMTNNDSSIFPSAAPNIQPSAVPQEPRYIGVHDTPEYKAESAKRDQALKDLARPAPGPVKAEIDPIEAILSAFASSQSALPSVQGRIMRGPMEMAAGRADLTNKTNQVNFENQQRASELGLKSAEKMIGELYERDAITQRLFEKKESDRLKRESNAAIQAARTNAGFAKALLQASGKGQITPEGVAQALLMTGMAKNYDDAITIGKQVYADMVANPNAQTALNQERLTLDQSKFDEGRRNKLREIIGKNAPETSLADKIDAIEELQRDFGMYPNQDPVALAKLLTDEQIQMRQRTATDKSRESLNKATEAYTNEKKKYLPATVASNLAKGLAYIDHLRNQDSLNASEFDFKQKKDIRDQQLEVYKFTLQGLQSTYGDLTTDIKSLRDERKAIESKLADYIEGGGDDENYIRGQEQKIRDVDGKLKIKGDLRTKIHEEADALRKKAREEDGLQSIEIAPIERSKAPDVGDNSAFNPPVGDDWIPPGADRDIGGGGQPAKRPSSSSNRNNRNGSPKPKQNPPKPKVTMPKSGQKVGGWSRSK